jgi:hypothetical protein
LSFCTSLLCFFVSVRVPFNAIVLGVEQLREDLYTEPLRPVEEMQDVINILHEQSKVVARVLNDTLSIQKIEDGAMALDMAPFNVIEMVCGTLRSFQPLLQEKNLILMTEMEDIDQASIRAHMKRFERRLRRRQELARMAGMSSSTGANGNAAGAVTDPDAVHIRIDELGTGNQAGAPSLPSITALSTVINPSPPAGLATEPTALPPNPYSNVYKDSAELQRIAEQCSREVLGDRYRLRQGQRSTHATGVQT